MFITTKVKITEEEYNKLLKCSRDEVEDYISDVAVKHLWNPAGYGFFRPMFFMQANEYFVSWEHYDSCD
jgi:hypothetical protein